MVTRPDNYTAATHTWRVGGTGGHWVHHSSGGSGCDSIGVGLGQDVIGPFGSVKLARKVADALNSAYELGFRDARLVYDFAENRPHFPDAG